MSRNSFFRHVGWLAVKLGLVAAALLFFYWIYLDTTLTQRFSQSRYQAPALVYGYALPLHPGQKLPPEQLRRRLQLLGYRAVADVRDSGQFQQTGDAFVLYRRPFDFADGPQMARKVALHFNDETLTKIISLPDGRELDSMRLEPPLIGRFSTHSREDRLLVGFELVPNLFVDTLLLVEDRNFYHHNGVAPLAIARALVANIRAGHTVQGGSTLTQQLVKNLYLTREQTLLRKAHEAMMALVIDARFSKNDILEAYLNEVYFGQDRGNAIHGLGLASVFYFGKQVQELNAADIALLVGLVKGPSYYDPRRHPERAKQRRDMILQLMFEHDLLSKPDYLAALRSDLEVKASGHLVSSSQPDYLDRVQQELAHIPLPADWQKQGLRIFTGLDPLQQAAAEQALQDTVRRLKKPDLQGAVVVADYHDGSVRALVGGTQNNAAGFNRALLALRPIGSLIKPVIYSLALQQPDRYQLATPLLDNPVILDVQGDKAWQPNNYDGEFLGQLPLYQAFVTSRNIPAVNVGLDIGPERIVEQLRALGVETPLHAYPSISLGASALSPYAVARLYAGLANPQGFRPLHTIEAITQHDGMSVYHHQPQPLQQVLSPESQYLTEYTMQGVVREGTGKRLGEAFPNAHLAGKSGTTNDLRDSWFVAIDAEQVMTVWMGYDDNRSTGLTGSSGALKVLRQMLKQQPPQPLQLRRPETIIDANFRSDSGVRVPDSCSDADPEVLRFPAIDKPVIEGMTCAGTVEEKSWWQRVFGN
ncbi:penicillin-binding protein 1B [Idiomarina tyrosinivorans]|uniref:Penicillin-binding protein 1B n=1 Tax=Idiomarina tyrosinivorans TaxID=1445662 RepID=A0A432ZS65_9GAMM|nr:penicillin-binding protein 1B [Idiomarina tyrosinivorans]RUO80676.1 penicillin-binding protein 1B [Idiomarina tyrosinivorans]